MLFILAVLYITVIILSIKIVLQLTFKHRLRRMLHLPAITIQKRQYVKGCLHPATVFVLDYCPDLVSDKGRYQLANGDVWIV